ncbi:Putative ornithine/DAP/Arg decarboxylase, alanine racemase/group IV decarboxylase [Colletotrichum destructivum]|uniref:Ornithine decarboxylase n=1 Tax=Colletotrichum destructivum TaxID=34406 RepID=A0AAX4I877_9PEZI|nr:Putative ornithine/DAP/Arg decarboxylase, alanine racemase/group IV decarboxylase [Colletotrichum destructivum]
MVMATAAIEHFAPATINYASTYQPVLKTSHFVDHAHHHSKHGVTNPKQLIGDALRQRVESIDHEICEPGDEDTFFVGDLGEVYRQHMRWKLNLPRVKPFYAVKCNPDPKVLQLLAALGTGFDCASKTEIDQVLNMGTAPERIIYAQPCKTNSYVRYVKAMGVRQMTFDNADELRKIAKLFPEAELYLRIMTDDESSLCRLSMKFGAAKEATNELLGVAKDLGLNVVGVSFHVGSGASDPMAFYKAVYDAYEVFEQGRAYGFEMKTLDIGGGFCGDTFEDMAAVLRGALDEYFPASSNVNIIAEPGRYYVSAAFTIACNIIARRTVDDPTLNEKRYMVYVNDGLYGNFSSIMFDHQHPVAKVLRAGSSTVYDTSAANACPDGEGIRYSVWGPTCDGIDRITETISFEQELDVGDWLYFEDMGAYTKCSATKFNGFSNEHDVIYVCSEPGAKALLNI